MTSNPLFIILPFVALLLGSLSVAGLWLWWTMSSEGSEEGSSADAQGDTLETISALPADAPAEEEKSEATLGDLLGRIRDAAQAVIPPPTARPAVNVAPQALPEGLVEVLRVYRDLADGSLVVELEGQRYRSLREIRDPNIGRRFLGNSNALAQFARLDKIDPGSLPSMPDLPPLPAAAPVTPQADVPTTAPAPASRKAEGPLSKAPQALGSFHAFGEAEPPQPQRRGFFAGREEPREKTPERTMADAIDELLQYHISQDAQWQNRRLKVRSDGMGGVAIELDGQIYEGVGDVPDIEAREFLLSVIREWEERQ